MDTTSLVTHNNPASQLRAEILSESEFDAWFNEKLGGQDLINDTSCADGRASFLLDLSEHDFVQYLIDPTITARVCLHLLDCTDENYVFVTGVFGTPSTASEYDDTKSFEWQVLVVEWPFITTHIVEEALRGYRSGLAILDVDTVNKCLQRHYPNSNYEQLRDWYMSDLFDLDAGGSGAPVLCEVLRRQNLAPTAFAGYLLKGLEL